MEPGMDRSSEIVIMDTRGLRWASSKARIEAVLTRRTGVLSVEANPVAQTATVTFDPAQTSVAALVGWIRECGYHCAGQSVPAHACDPVEEPGLAHRAEHDVHDEPPPGEPGALTDSSMMSPAVVGAALPLRAPHPPLPLA